MIRDLNPDQTTRDSILFSETPSFGGGIGRFFGLSLENLEKLINQNFIELDDCQNDAPSVNEIYMFMKMYPTVTAHGYAVTKERSDYRVSLEGVECTDPGTICDPNFMRDFTNTFRHADEFSLTSEIASCWYD